MTPEIAEADEAAEVAEDLEAHKSKKLGRWERRQAKIEKHKKAMGGQEQTQRPSVPMDQDDLLELVDKSAGSTASEPLPTQSRKRLKLRNGVAKGIGGTHTFFTADEANGSAGDVSELAQLAEEMGAVTDGKEVGDKNCRANFLKDVARELSQRDTSDAANSRARIRDQHQKLRRKDKQERRGDASDDGSGEEAVATLGGGESHAVSDAAASRSPSPTSALPARAAKRKIKEQPAVAAPAPAAIPFAQSLATGTANLEDLEREALGRLSGGGLFM